MKKISIILLAGIMACHSSSKIKKTTTVAAPKPAVDTVATVTTTPVDPVMAKAIVKVPGITAERLTEGNKVYMADCTRCHGMKEPANYTAEQWHPILVRMFDKAKITDEHEKALITDYVIAKSK